MRTVIDNMIDINLRHNHIDPASATALDRQRACERCEQTAKIMGAPLVDIARSFSEYFASDAVTASKPTDEN